MFSFNKKKNETTNLQALIDTTQSQMEAHESDSKEYGAMLTQLEKLYRLQSLETTGFKISPDVLVTVVANLLGIFLILGHERLHVVTSKAVNFVVKTKL